MEIVAAGKYELVNDVPFVAKAGDVISVEFGSDGVKRGSVTESKVLCKFRDKPGSFFIEEDNLKLVN